MTAADTGASYRKTRVGTERSFGFVFTVVFLLVALFPKLHGGHVRQWALTVSAAFLLVTLVAPKFLKPLNIVWFRIGILLHHIVNPIIMTLIYWLTVMPVGLIAKAVGKDFLRLKWDGQAKTYWISREPPGPLPGSMSRQF